MIFLKTLYQKLIFCYNYITFKSNKKSMENGFNNYTHKKDEKVQERDQKIQPQYIINQPIKQSDMNSHWPNTQVNNDHNDFDQFESISSERKKSKNSSEVPQKSKGSNTIQEIFESIESEKGNDDVVQQNNEIVLNMSSSLKVSKKNSNFQTSKKLKTEQSNDREEKEKQIFKNFFQSKKKLEDEENCNKSIGFSAFESARSEKSQNMSVQNLGIGRSSMQKSKGGEVNFSMFEEVVQRNSIESNLSADKRPQNLNNLPVSGLQESQKEHDELGFSNFGSLVNSERSQNSIQSRPAQKEEVGSSLFNQKKSESNKSVNSGKPQKKSSLKNQKMAEKKSADDFFSQAEGLRSSVKPQEQLNFSQFESVRQSVRSEASKLSQFDFGPKKEEKKTPEVGMSLFKSKNSDKEVRSGTELSKQQGNISDFFGEKSSKISKGQDEIGLSAFESARSEKSQNMSVQNLGIGRSSMQKSKGGEVNFSMFEEVVQRNSIESNLSADKRPQNLNNLPVSGLQESQKEHDELGFSNFGSLVNSERSQNSIQSRPAQKEEVGSSLFNQKKSESNKSVNSGKPQKKSSLKNQKMAEKKSADDFFSQAEGLRSSVKPQEQLNFSQFESVRQSVRSEASKLSQFDFGPKKEEKKTPEVGMSLFKSKNSDKEVRSGTELSKQQGNISDFFGEKSSKISKGQDEIGLSAFESARSEKSQNMSVQNLGIGRSSMQKSKGGEVNFSMFEQRNSIESNLSADKRPQNLNNLPVSGLQESQKEHDELGFSNFGSLVNSERSQNSIQSRPAQKEEVGSSLFNQKKSESNKSVNSGKPQKKSSLKNQKMAEKKSADDFFSQAEGLRSSVKPQEQLNFSQFESVRQSVRSEASKLSQFDFGPKKEEKKTPEVGMSLFKSKNSDKEVRSGTELSKQQGNISDFFGEKSSKISKGQNEIGLSAFESARSEKSQNMSVQNLGIGRSSMQKSKGGEVNFSMFEEVVQRNSIESNLSADKRPQNLNNLPVSGLQESQKEHDELGFSNFGSLVNSERSQNSIQSRPAQKEEVGSSLFNQKKSESNKSVNSGKPQKKSSLKNQKMAEKKSADDFFSQAEGLRSSVKPQEQLNFSQFESVRQSVRSEASKLSQFDFGPKKEEKKTPEVGMSLFKSKNSDKEVRSGTELSKQQGNISDFFGEKSSKISKGQDEIGLSAFESARSEKSQNMSVQNLGIGRSSMQKSKGGEVNFSMFEQRNSIESNLSADKRPQNLNNLPVSGLQESQKEHDELGFSNFGSLVNSERSQNSIQSRPAQKEEVGSSLFNQKKSESNKSVNSGKPQKKSSLKNQKMAEKKSADDFFSQAEGLRSSVKPQEQLNFSQFESVRQSVRSEASKLSQFDFGPKKEEKKTPEVGMSLFKSKNSDKEVRSGTELSKQQGNISDFFGEKSSKISKGQDEIGLSAFESARSEKSQNMSVQNLGIGRSSMQKSKGGEVNFSMFEQRNSIESNLSADKRPQNLNNLPVSGLQESQKEHDELGFSNFGSLVNSERSQNSIQSRPAQKEEVGSSLFNQKKSESNKSVNSGKPQKKSSLKNQKMAEKKSADDFFSQAEGLRSSVKPQEQLNFSQFESVRQSVRSEASKLSQFDFGPKKEEKKTPEVGMSLFKSKNSDKEVRSGTELSKQQGNISDFFGEKSSKISKGQDEIGLSAFESARSEKSQNMSVQNLGIGRSSMQKSKGGEVNFSMFEEVVQRNSIESNLSADKRPQNLNNLPVSGLQESQKEHDELGFSNFGSLVNSERSQNSIQSRPAQKEEVGSSLFNQKKSESNKSVNSGKPQKKSSLKNQKMAEKKSADDFFSQAEGLRSSVKPQEQLNFSQFESVRQSVRSEASKLSQFDFGPKKEEKKTPEVGMSLFKSKNSDKEVRSGTELSKQQGNISDFFGEKSSKISKGQDEIGLSAFESARSEKSQNMSVQNLGIGRSSMQKSKGGEVNFSMFEEVVQRNSIESNLSADKRPQNLNNLPVSGLQESQKEHDELGFSNFGSLVNSERSQNSIQSRPAQKEEVGSSLFNQKKSESNKSVNSGKPQKKSSLKNQKMAEKKSADDFFSQAEGLRSSVKPQEQLNFSQFESVRQSVRSEASKLSQFDFGPKKEEKKTPEVGMSLFKSKNSDKEVRSGTELSKQQGNISDFFGEKSSKISKGQNEIGLSAFESARSEKSQNMSVQNLGIGRSSMQKSKGGEVNFSMFEEVVQRNSIESNLSADKRPQNLNNLPVSGLQESQKEHDELGFSNFGSLVNSERSQNSIQSRPAQKEEVGSSLFNQKKSESNKSVNSGKPQKKSSLKNQKMAEKKSADDFFSQAEGLRSSVKPQEQLNFSQFESVRQSVRSEASKLSQFDFGPKKEEKKTPEVGMSLFMSKNSDKEVRSGTELSKQQGNISDFFGEKSSKISKGQDEIGLSAFESARSEKSQNMSVQNLGIGRSSMQKSKGGEVNFSMFEQRNSIESNLSADKRPQNLNNLPVSGLQESQKEHDELGFSNFGSLVNSERSQNSIQSRPAQKEEVGSSLFNQKKSESNKSVNSGKPQKKSSLKNQKMAEKKSADDFFSQAEGLRSSVKPQEQLNFSQFESVRQSVRSEASKLSQFDFGPKKEEKKTPEVGMSLFKSKNSDKEVRSGTELSKQQGNISDFFGEKSSKISKGQDEIGLSAFESARSEKSQNMSVQNLGIGRSSMQKSKGGEVNFSMFEEVVQRNSIESNLSADKRPQNLNNLPVSGLQESQKEHDELGFSNFGSLVNSERSQNSIQSRPAQKEEVGSSLFNQKKSESNKSVNSGKPQKKSSLKNQKMAEKKSADYFFSQAEGLRSSVKPQEQLNFSQFESVRQSVRSEASKLSQFDFGPKKEEKKTPEVGMSLFKSKNSDKEVRSGTELSKQQGNISDFFREKSSKISKGQNEIGLSAFESARSEKSQNMSVQNLGIGRSSMQKSKGGEVNFSMFEEVVQRNSIESNLSADKRPQNLNNLPVSGLQESQKEHDELGFSNFGSLVNSERSQNSIQSRPAQKEEVGSSLFNQKKSESNKSVNSGKPQKKSSLKNQKMAEKKSADDFFSQAEGLRSSVKPQEQLNFSQFESVRQSVRSEASKLSQFDFGPKNQPATKNSKTKDQFLFQMFSSQPIQIGNSLQTQPKALNLQNKISQFIEHQYPKHLENLQQSIRLSMFGSVKNSEEISLSQISIPEPKLSIQNQVATSKNIKNQIHNNFFNQIPPQKSQTSHEQINFSKFQSVRQSLKSQKNSLFSQVQQQFNPPKASSPPQQELRFSMFGNIQQNVSSFQESKLGIFSKFPQQALPSQNSSHQHQNVSRSQAFSQISSTQFFRKDDEPYQNIVPPKQQQCQISQKQPEQQQQNPFENSMIQASKKFNQIYMTLQNQAKQLNIITTQSQNYLHNQKQTIQLFMKDLQQIKQDLLNLSQQDIDTSSVSSSITNQEIQSIIQCLEQQKQVNNQKISMLFDRMIRIQQIIKQFIQMVNLKTEKIKQEEYYKLYSPLQLNHLFKKKKNQDRIDQINILEPKKSKQSVRPELYSQFYIRDKYYGKNAYKKLFAPKNTIKHKSSYLDVTFDYCFEVTKSRKMLRIMITLKNISSYTLNDLTCEVNRENPKIKMVRPQKVSLPNLQSNETIHQIIYVSQFNKDFYYIPLEIRFKTQSSSHKQLIVPVSVDVLRFLQKVKINLENIVNMNLPSKRTFYLKNKSQLPFTSAAQYKIIKYTSISQTDSFDLFEKFLQNDTYAIQIHSNGRFYAQKIEEYLKFLYDS